MVYVRINVMNTKTFRILLALIFIALMMTTFSACPKKTKGKDDKEGSRTTTQTTTTTTTDGKPPEGGESSETSPGKVNIEGVWDVTSIVESDSTGANTPGTEHPPAVWHIRVSGNTATIDIEGSDSPIIAKIDGLKITARPENTEPWYDISGTIAPEGNEMHGTNKSTTVDAGNTQEIVDSWTAIKRPEPTGETGDGGKPPEDGGQTEPQPEPETNNPPEGGSTK